MFAPFAVQAQRDYPLHKGVNHMEMTYIPAKDVRAILSRTAVIEDWPIGRGRCTARFEIERTKLGERAVRTTVGAPKKLTYARKARIVDGGDGRTYLAVLTESGFVSIMRGDMKYQHETLWPDSPRFAAVRALFEGDAS